MQYNRLKNFIKHTNLHGLKYVADEENHYGIRIFWVTLFLINFGFMLMVLQVAYNSFEENAVSFVTETTYLDWNSTFPAVTICPISGSDVIWDKNDKILAQDFDSLKQFIIDLIYFTGSCYSCISDCQLCDKLNFTEQVEKYRKKCTEIFSICKWYQNEFNCCEQFLPLETEYGICYSLNSIHTGSVDRHKMNRKTGPGEIWLRVKEDVRMYFHAPEDVPFINSDPELRKEILLGEALNISINLIEINNDENVKEVPIRKRGCRYAWENQGLTAYKFYSYSTCVVQCHAVHHIELCNCSHHLMPTFSKEKYCNLEGLKCLTNNFGISVDCINTLNRLHARNSDKPGIFCECLPSCLEPEYTVVAATKETTSHLSEISLKIQSLPTSRFKRIVLRSTLDLVVSFGGAASLFLGASLISIIEAIYLFWTGNINT